MRNENEVPFEDKQFTIPVADRLKRLPPYLFGKINKMKYQKRVAGIDVTRGSTREIAELGVGHIPEDRIGVGMAGSASVRDNAILRHYRTPELSSGYRLKRPSIIDFATRLVEAGRVQTRSISMRAPLPTHIATSSRERVFRPSSDSRRFTATKMSSTESTSVPSRSNSTASGTAVGKCDGSLALLVMTRRSERAARTQLPRSEANATCGK